MNKAASYAILISVAVVSLGVFIVGLVFLNIYCKSHMCPNHSKLPPGGQATCNKSADDLFQSMEVTTVNETGPYPIVTYVFNKEPARIFTEEKFEDRFESTRYHTLYMTLLTGAVFYK